MIPPELLDRLPNDGAWGIFVTVVLAIWIGVKTLAKADTDKMEQSFGWFGHKASQIVRWFRDKERRQIEHEQRLEDARVRVFEEKIQSLENMITYDRKWYEEQLHVERDRNEAETQRLEQRIEDVVEERRVVEKWMEYAMQWASEVYSLAVQHSWNPQITPLMSFSVWRKTTQSDVD
ncbi:hypothetical protein HMPREF2526_05965 [Corynebacterium sp. HMSC070E08]|uniref:hypothetical protein n=1 Tax=Corynebacterium sp. HMSC070E08 TaxID=1715006 RepID=UPI0008A38045|nr:hypothetical protein [Corynebacterium sp. HMSC070E08]OFN80034.1 hypothetical protein HMPREF2526_05965 [Corynebacterium sp. HMSC070E08]